LPERAKSVVLINLFGGPPHMDMFDLKPNAPQNVRGEMIGTPSSVPGLPICSLMPGIAGLMHEATLVRTYSHKYNSHNPYNVLTGFDGGSDRENYFAKRSDHPSMGSVMQYAGLRSRDVPSYIWMPTHPGHSQGKYRAGPYGGFLGSQFDPMFTSYSPSFTETEGRNSHINPAVPLASPTLSGLETLPDINLQRMTQRRSLLEQFDGSVSQFNSSASVSNLSHYKQEAFQLLAERVRQLLDGSRSHLNAPGVPDSPTNL
jgi:hypothetical protein